MWFGFYGFIKSRFCRNAGDASELGKGFFEGTFSAMLPVLNKVSSNVTSKAMEDLFLSRYTAGGGFFFMKGAAGFVVFARFFKLHARVDNLNDIDPVE